MTQPLYHQPEKSLTFTAAEDLEAHRLVIIDPTDTTWHSVRYPEADGDTQLVGVTLHAADSGDDVEVAVAGIVKLKVNGNVANIAYGDFLSAHDTAGYGRKRTAVTVECIGQAMGSSTADGDLISVRIALQGG
jgi:hypothetical protein